MEAVKTRRAPLPTADERAAEAFFACFPPERLGLLRASAALIIERLGREQVSAGVAAVAMGRNIRDFTEPVTSERLSLITIALREQLARAKAIGVLPANIPHLSAVRYRTKGVPVEHRTLALWWLGLTKKGLDNIVRGHANLPSYAANYAAILRDVCVKEGTPYDQLLVDRAIGAMNVGVRGSSKSANGKLFEKLVLGSVLWALGLDYMPEEPTGRPLTSSFWLTHREDKRESDAVIADPSMRGIFIDFGFIEFGNTEVSQDKLTRYEAHTRVGADELEMHTAVIIGAVGPGSNAPRLAADKGLSLIQMKDPGWVTQLASLMERKIGFRSPVLDVRGVDDVLALAQREWISERLTQVPLDLLLRAADSTQRAEADESEA